MTTAVTEVVEVEAFTACPDTVPAPTPYVVSTAAAIALTTRTELSRKGHTTLFGMRWLVLSTLAVFACTALIHFTSPP